MRKSWVACLVVLVASSALPSARAQSAQSVGAYLALNGTPIAALPPVLTSTILTALQRTVQFSARYGYLNDNAFVTNETTGAQTREGPASNNGGLTIVLPTALGSTVSLTAGFWYPSGRNYSAHLMLGAAGDYGIGSTQVGGNPDSPLLSLAVDGEVGFGKPRHGTFWAGRLGAPVTLGERGEGMRIALFATPSIAYGYTNVDGVNITGQPTSTTQSGVRFMIGGGVGVYTPASTLSMNLGFQHVYITGASTLVGLVVSLGTK